MTAEVHQKHAAEQAAEEGRRRRQDAERDEGDDDGDADKGGHQPAGSRRARRGRSNRRSLVATTGDVCGRIASMCRHGLLASN